MDINDSVFDGRSDVAGPTSNPRLAATSDSSEEAPPPKNRRGRPPKKNKDAAMPPPPPPPPQALPASSSPSPSSPRKLLRLTPSGPTPPLQPAPPPADGTPRVVMVPTGGREAESVARREYLSRQVDRAAEEIRRQLQLDKDRVTPRTTPVVVKVTAGREAAGSSGGPPTPLPTTSAAGAERIVSAYVPTRQTMADFERLDVLVCGSCKSVFHHIDEFKSHSSTCSKRHSTGTAATASNSAEIFEDVELDVSSEAAVAMVIWCNTIRRILVQGGVQFDDAGEYPYGVTPLK